MKNGINKLLLLSAVVFVAAFLRFYQLGQNPPSLTWDEASWGYNAYSLGIDGRDEFGRFLPHDYLESFGDFKPPMYAYLDIIPVKIFGLNEFATRFPSALFGVLTVLMTYFLTKRIFGNSQKEIRIKSLVLDTPIIATFILAISPWHIMLSRAAFEANVATFFLVAGVWAFLAGAQDKKWYLVLAAASFALSLYTFNTARVVAPLLVLVLAIGIGNRKELLEQKKKAIVAFIVGIVLVLPTAKFLLSPQANLRFKEVNIFSDVGVVENTNQEIANDNNVLWSKAIHNRRFAYAVEYLRHYFDNVSPSFLFIKGDGNPKFSTQDVGEMYLWDLPFFIAGILFLLRKREGYWWIIPLWLLIGIAPSAVARETPHALRIEATLPTFQILVGLGVYEFLVQVSKVRIKYPIYALTFLILFSVLFFNFLYFYHGYLSHYSREFSGEWQYGYKESINYVTVNQSKFSQVNVTTEFGRPYIYYLFYTKIKPRDFRKTAKISRDPFGFVSVDSFDKYRFAKDLWTIDNKRKRVLYINAPSKVPPKAQIFKKFYLLNGSVALTAYTL